MDAMTTPPGTGVSQAELVRGWAECWQILRENGKTFHVMARVLGPARGNAIAAVYGFARVADDLVDERRPDEDPAAIRARLAEMGVELRRAVAGTSHDARFAALGETVRHYRIPLEPFDDLLAGVAMDLEPVRIRTFAELDLYCYRVAGTVGLMITPIAGYRPGSLALQHAKTLGTAMQLTNILRDVGEDLGLGRVYLPEEDLRRFGLTLDDLLTRRVDARFRALMQFEIDRTQRLYRDGLKLIPLLTSGRGRAAFEFAVEAYSGILGKIRDADYDVFHQRAHLTLSEKLALLPSSVWHAWTAALLHAERP